MKKIKILYGLEAADGGALKHLIYLSKNLDKNTFEITIVLSDQRGNDLSLIKEILQNHVASVIIIPIKRQIHLLYDLKAFCLVFWKIYNHGFNVVHAHSSKAGAIFRIAAWLNNVPLILYTPHCFYFQALKGIKKYLFAFIERLLAKITDLIIVSKEEMKEALEMNICNKAKLVNINNAIDFKDYEVNLIKRAQPHIINSDCFVIGTVGRLVMQKNHRELLNAAKQVLSHKSNVLFLIIGDGIEKPKLDEFIIAHNLSDNVLLLSYKEFNKDFFSFIDLYINTSLYEGVSYSMLEAVWFKTPIIALNNNTFSSTKEINEGLSLANAIIHTIDNKSAMKYNAEANFQTLNEKHSFDIFIKKHEIVYKSLETK